MAVARIAEKSAAEKIVKELVEALEWKYEKYRNWSKEKRSIEFAKIFVEELLARSRGGLEELWKKELFLDLGGREFGIREFGRERIKRQMARKICNLIRDYYSIENQREGKKPLEHITWPEWLKTYGLSP